MELARKLNSYSKEYWDFSYYRNDNPLVRYPATMVAPMQACIIKEVILADSTIRNVLDPFSGSGTVLIEGQKLGLDVIGYDINPLFTINQLNNSIYLYFFIKNKQIIILN